MESSDSDSDSDSDSGSDADKGDDKADETESTETKKTEATEQPRSNPMSVLQSRPPPAKTEPAWERNFSPSNTREELPVETDVSEFPDVLDISSDSADLADELARDTAPRGPTQQYKPAELAAKPVPSVAAVPVKAVTAVEEPPVETDVSEFPDVLDISAGSTDLADELAEKPAEVKVARDTVPRQPIVQYKLAELAVKPVASVTVEPVASVTAVPVKVRAVTATKQQVTSVAAVKVTVTQAAASVPVKAEPKRGSAEPTQPEDDNAFQGPDPTGSLRWWTYNESDGWCYSPASSWIYNPQTAVYFDSSTQTYCQYSAETGIIAGTCEPDMDGLIRFVPTPKEPVVAGQPPLQQSTFGTGAGCNSSATEPLATAYSRSSVGVGYSSTAAVDPTQPVLSSLGNNLNSQGRPQRRQLDATSLLGKAHDRPRTSHAQRGVYDLY